MNKIDMKILEKQTPDDFTSITHRIKYHGNCSNCYEHIKVSHGVYTRIAINSDEELIIAYVNQGSYCNDNLFCPNNDAIWIYEDETSPTAEWIYYRQKHYDLDREDDDSEHNTDIELLQKLQSEEFYDCEVETIEEFRLLWKKLEEFQKYSENLILQNVGKEIEHANNALEKMGIYDNHEFYMSKSYRDLDFNEIDSILHKNRYYDI